jgi:EmrB/QacA subfamily drug resistance transporter
MTAEAGATPGPSILPEEPRSGMIGRRSFLALFPCIMLPMFLSVADQTIVATALPAIAASLGDVERISWIVVSYLIANTIAAPVYGRLGDVLGRRRMMIAALVLFIAASLFCAMAPNVIVLTIARLLQGLGGGGLMTLSQALVGEAIPARERPRYQGYLSTVVVCSASFGPVAGGVLTQYLGWRSVFYVNLPLGLIALVLALRLPKIPGRGEGFHFDTLGLIFFAGFVAPILLALEQVQRLDTASPFSIGVLLAIAILSVLLLMWQERRTPSPLLPVKLLSKPAIWRSDALAAFHGAALLSLITFIPIYCRVARGYSASEIGILLLPLSVGVGFGSLVTSRLVTRTGRTTIYPTIALPIVTAILIFTALTLPYLSRFELMAVLGVMTLFMGTVMNVVQLTVQAASGPAALGAGAGSVQFSRSVGATFGTAGVGALVFVVLSFGAPEATQLFGGLVERGPAMLDALDPNIRLAVTNAVTHAFQAALLLVAAFTAGGAVLAAWIPIRRI